MSSSARKYQKTKGYESLNRTMLQDNSLSLEARGLLAYMESMPEKWIFHKTMLHKTFSKNKRSSIDRMWNELIDHNFLIAFRKREGKKYSYEYFFTQDKFDEEDIMSLQDQMTNSGFELAPRTGKKNNENKKERTDIIETDSSLWNGEVEDKNNIWTDEYQQSNMGSPKSADIKFNNKKLTTEYNDTRIVDTKRYENYDLINQLTNSQVLDMGNFPCLSDRTIQLLSMFGEISTILIDKIYQAKRKVERENQKFVQSKSSTGTIEKIHGELWTNDIERCVMQLIFKYKTGLAKEKPIHNLIGYFYKAMERLWNMAFVIETNVSITALIAQQEDQDGIIYQHFPEKLTKKQLESELVNARKIIESRVT